MDDHNYKTMFQKCPKCEGSGRVTIPHTMNTSSPCPVCNGAMIISEDTGLPPVKPLKI